MIPKMLEGDDNLENIRRIRTKAHIGARVGLSRVGLQLVYLIFQLRYSNSDFNNQPNLDSVPKFVNVEKFEIKNIPNFGHYGQLAKNRQKMQKNALDLFQSFKIRAGSPILVKN